MLQLVLGRAKTGKSTLLESRVAQRAAQGREVLFLVPEQASYQTESRLFSALPHGDFSRVQVLSITRLCETIFAQNGGLSVPDLTGVGAASLMASAFYETKDQLRLYGGQPVTEGFLSALIAAREEFQNMGLSPQAIDEAAQALGSPALQDKLGDFSAVFAAFDALLDRSFTDEPGKIYRAIDRRGDFFLGKSVFVDAFTGFTKPQHDLLDCILREAEEVTVALCCDDPWQGDGRELSPFYEARKTARRLARNCREMGVAVAEPERLDTPRFASADLCQIEAAFAGRRPAPLKEGKVRVFAAPDRFAECDWAAAEIDRLCRQGYRYREIAVLCRRADDCAVAIRQAFDRREIPYFIDENQPVYAKPTVSLVLAILRALTRGLDADGLLLIARQGLADADEETLCDLENYLYTWNLSGAALKRPFEKNPDGFGGPLTPEGAETLRRVEALRQAVCAPLFAFEKSCRRSTGGKIVKGLFSLLERYGAARLGERQVARLDELGESALADDFVAQWDALVAVLDELYLTLGDQPLDIDRFAEIFRLSLKAGDFGAIPRSLDQVIVGSADKTRLEGCRVCFVLGATFGAFPLQEDPPGLLTQKEKNALAEWGLAYAVDTGEAVSRELGYCYNAVCAPSERLYIGYHTASLKGEQFEPSELVETALKIPGLKVEAGELPGEEAVSNRETAFAALCAGEDPALAAALTQALGEPERRRLERVRRSGEGYRFTLGREASYLLFGPKLNLSPTGLEQFENCPFSFYLKRGLGLAPPPKGEVSPLETGSFIHYLLEQALKTYGRVFPAVPREELDGFVDTAAARYGKEQLGEENLTKRQQYLLQKVRENTKLLLTHLQRELAQSRFFPAAFELPVGEGKDAPPLRVQAADGTEVAVQGYVDRVDTCEIDGQPYLRVVDYKSGGKAFSLSDVYSGLNMQMLIYLFSLCQGEGPFAGSLPAGVLYMPAAVTYSDVEGEPDEGSAALFSKGLTQSGLVLRDLEVVRAMEPGVAGDFIPVKQNKDGTFSKYSRLATLEQMGQIEGHIRRTMAGLVDALRQGEIGAVPLQKDQFLPCTYCDYRRVCLIEEKDERRECPKLKGDAEFYQRTKGE